MEERSEGGGWVGQKKSTVPFPLLVCFPLAQEPTVEGVVGQARGPSSCSKVAITLLQQTIPRKETDGTHGSPALL